MIFTTTNTVDGYEITDYIRIIAGETVIGINMLKDFGASIRNITGGRSAGYESEPSRRVRRHSMNCGGAGRSSGPMVWWASPSIIRPWERRMTC